VFGKAADRDLRIVEGLAIGDMRWFRRLPPHVISAQVS